MLILGPKMSHLPCSGHNNNFPNNFKIVTINEQISRSSKMLILVSKMPYLPHFRYNKNSPQKMGSLIFMCLLEAQPHAKKSG